MNILVIEDNKLYYETLKLDLEKFGYKVSSPINFRCLESIDYKQFDVVMLDITLPNIDGRNLIKTIKKSVNPVVFMLTSIDNGTVELDCLKLGADDYIIKPHYGPVLDFKLKQHLKLEKDIVEICSHKLSMETLKIDDTINLTAKEYKVLLCLHAKGNEVCSKEELLRCLWENDYFVELGALYTLVFRLRKKLEDTNINIKSTNGGYQIAS